MQSFEEGRYSRITQKISNRATRSTPVKLSRLRLSAPIASFTFDDFAKSAWTAGGRIVEGFGARATYYVAGGLCGRQQVGVPCYDAEDLSALAGRGHDVGCHTFDHIAVPDFSSARVEESLAANRAYLRNITGKSAMMSFSYPFGLASIRTKRLLSSKFAACQGVYPGVNAGWTDFSQLSALCLHRTDLPFEKYIQKALQRSGWLIFIGHDVSEEPSPYGCSPRVLENALRLVTGAGIEVLTMEAALRRIFGNRIASADSVLAQ